jgi:glycine dehydrogenase
VSAARHRPDRTPRQSLSALEGHGEFATRHIGTDDADRLALLAEIGLDTLDRLIDEAVPAAIRSHQPNPR